MECRDDIIALQCRADKITEITVRGDLCSRPPRIRNPKGPGPGMLTERRLFEESMAAFCGICESVIK